MKTTGPGAANTAASTKNGRFVFGHTACSGDKGGILQEGMTYQARTAPAVHWGFGDAGAACSKDRQWWGHAGDGMLSRNEAKSLTFDLRVHRSLLLLGNRSNEVANYLT